MIFKQVANLTLHIGISFFRWVQLRFAGVHTMIKKVLAFLETVPAEELLDLKNDLESIIQRKFENELGRRKSRRAKVHIPATADIERETEFFYKRHKIIIREMSTNGMFFTTAAPVIDNDILGVSFRSPHSGQQRSIDCQAVRVKELTGKSGYEYEVAAKAVDKTVVRAYRDFLKNRGR